MIKKRDNFLFLLESINLQVDKIVQLNLRVKNVKKLYLLVEILLFGKQVSILFEVITLLGNSAQFFNSFFKQKQYF